MHGWIAINDNTLIPSIWTPDRSLYGHDLKGHMELMLCLKFDFLNLPLFVISRAGST